MFVFGICRLDQLHPRRLRRRLGRRRFVAATLYPQACDASHSERDQLLELVLCQLAHANRTYKRTYANRFVQFDQAIARLLAARGSQQTLRVHDVAVSNGITAVQLYQLLMRTVHGPVEYLASDLSTGVVAVREGAVTLVVDPVDQSNLQLIRPPFVFNLQKKENARYFPVNWLVRQWLERRVLPRLRQRFLDGDAQLAAESIDLLHPEFQALVRGSERFHFRRADIMQPLPGSYNLVRAMNILNPSYFDESEIRRAVRNIRNSLTVGGLFATGSNQENNSPVHGAIYRKTAQGFEQLVTSGKGSPVGDLILDG